MIKPQKNQVTKLFRSSSRTKLNYSKSDPCLKPTKSSPTPLKDSNTSNTSINYINHNQSSKKPQKIHMPPTFPKPEDITFSPQHFQNLQEVSKFSKDPFPEVYQIKPNPYFKKNMPKARNFSGDFLSNPANSLIDILIKIENNEGPDLSASKIKKYLSFFDTTSEYFPDLQKVLPRVKDLFEELFKDYLKKEKELKTLKFSTERLAETSDLSVNLSLLEKFDSSFSAQIIEENKSLNEQITTLSSQLKSCKSKEKQYQKFILFLKAKEQNFEKHFKDFFSKKKSKSSTVPNLMLSNVANSVTQGKIINFHEEFLLKAPEFSESWRSMLPELSKVSK